jgi:DNA-binding MarR family transcriptional regulator
MPTTRERDRTEAVQALFDGLLQFSRALKARSGDWGHAAHDLTRGDVFTLGILDARGSIRCGQIAVAMNVDPSVVSRELVALERLELVTRHPDPEDGRAELITITARGHERLLEARAAICGALADRLSHWDLDELARATAMFDELSTLLHQPLLPQPSRNSSKDSHV